MQDWMVIPALLSILGIFRFSYLHAIDNPYSSIGEVLDFRRGEACPIHELLTQLLTPSLTLLGLYIHLMSSSNPLA